MQSRSSSLIFDVAAALFLTISVTMLTDFTHRMLSADPDSVGILAVSAPAFLTVVASGSFAKAGWQWLEGGLGLTSKQAVTKARWRFGLSAGLFALMVPLWLYLPPWLARVYTARGYVQQKDDPSGAMRNFQRAIALDPQYQVPYLNLGVVLEGFYRYDDAADQYRKAIIARHTDPTPYNNLARVLLLDGKSLTALRIADDALQLDLSRYPGGPAGLKKNRAWAEYNLGFYRQAVTDAMQSGTAAADCVLAETYTKLGEMADARNAWIKFNAQYAVINPTQPVVEPDCTRLAEDALVKK